MKFSSKILKCQLSPVRKFNPCADQAVAAGRTIYHLNIGQPDVKTPESFYQAVREFREPTLEYAPASGLPAYIDAVRGYYAKLGVKLEREDILATSGGGFYADPADGRSEIRIAYVHNYDYLRRAIQLLGKGIAAYNAKRGA